MLSGHFELRIELGNEEMQTDADLADALSNVIDRLDRGLLNGSISDVNGNTVGSYKVSES